MRDEKKGEEEVQVEPNSTCDCHLSSCRPPQRVKQAVELSKKTLARDKEEYERRKKELMIKIDERKAEVLHLIDVMDAETVTDSLAGQYE